MGEVTHSLGRYRVIAIDTSVFVYFLERDPVFGSLASDALTMVERGALRGLTSRLTLAALVTFPYSRGNTEVAEFYQNDLTAFPNLSMLDVDRHIARSAAWIRGRYGFRLPDAAHLATAIELDADTFLTNDRRLQQFEELPVTLLSDFVH